VDFHIYIAFSMHWIKGFSSSKFCSATEWNLKFSVIFSHKTQHFVWTINLIWLITTAFNGPSIALWKLYHGSSSYFISIDMEFYFRWYKNRKKRHCSIFTNLTDSMIRISQIPYNICLFWNIWLVLLNYVWLLFLKFHFAFKPTSMMNMIGCGLDARLFETALADTKRQ
jgi:hypothetical protein